MGGCRSGSLPVLWWGVVEGRNLSELERSDRASCSASGTPMTLMTGARFLSPRTARRCSATAVTGVNSSACGLGAEGYARNTKLLSANGLIRIGMLLRQNVVRCITSARFMREMRIYDRNPSCRQARATSTLSAVTRRCVGRVNSLPASVLAFGNGPWVRTASGIPAAVGRSLL